MRSSRVFALLFVSSCLFPDLGALSRDDAGGTDATTDVAADAPAKDATSDVTLDAPPSDAGPDVKPSPCAQPHTFCDDFDDGSLGATWSQTTNNGGTLLQSTNAVTEPFALEARVPAGGHPQVQLSKDFAAAPTRFHFECDLLLLGTQTSGMEIDYVDFDFSPAPAGFDEADFNIERLMPGGSDLEEYTVASGADGGLYEDDPVSEDFSSWKHLVVDIDFTKATFAAMVDGATIDTMSMKPPVASAPITLSVGVTYAGGLTTQWSVLVDDVVVDLD